MNQSARLEAALTAIKTAQIIEKTHPKIWATAYSQATTPPSRPARWMNPDPADYLAQLQHLGGTATDTEWKRRCATALNAGRKRYEQARDALLEQGHVTSETTTRGSTKRITWALAQR